MSCGLSVSDPCYMETALTSKSVTALLRGEVGIGLLKKR